MTRDGFTDLRPRGFIHDQAESPLWFMVHDCSSRRSGDLNSLIIIPNAPCRTVWNRLSLELPLPTKLCQQNTIKLDASADENGQCFIIIIVIIAQWKTKGNRSHVPVFLCLNLFCVVFYWSLRWQQTGCGFDSEEPCSMCWYKVYSTFHWKSF